MFVCHNLALIGDQVIRRKHTIKAKRELPGLVTEIVAPLQAQRIAQNQKLLAYQQAPITDAAADHAIITMIGRTSSAADQWERPAHDWGDETAWRLFNAATFAQAGKVAERPDLPKKLHQVIDGVGERVQ